MKEPTKYVPATPFDLTGFTFDYEEGAAETPGIIQSLAQEMGDSGFKRSSRGVAMFRVGDVEYMAEIDCKMMHIIIGLCEYVDGGVIDAGPFKGKRVMMPTMKTRSDA